MILTIRLARYQANLKEFRLQLRDLRLHHQVPRQPPRMGPVRLRRNSSPPGFIVPKTVRKEGRNRVLDRGLADLEPDEGSLDLTTLCPLPICLFI